MVDNEKRVKIQMIIVVSCVIFAVLMLTALIMGLVNLASSSNKKRQLLNELNSVNYQLETNADNIEYYQSQEYIDRIAREYLNMQGKDEISFVGK